MTTSTPLLAVVLWLVWGGTFIAVKVGLTDASPAWFGVLRALLASLVLAAVLLLLRPATELRVLRDPVVLRRGAVLGLANVGGLIGFTHYAMLEAAAGFSAILVYTQPFLVALGAHYLLGEPLTRRRVAGLLAGWCGVAAVVSGRLTGGEASLTSVALLIGAALSWSVGTLLFKTLARDVPLWPVLLWQNVVGAVPLGVLAALEPARADWSPALVLSLLVAGAGAGVGGFGLQYVLLRRGAASAVGSWIFAVPIVSSVMSIAFLGESAEPTLLVGVAAVAIGIYLVNRPARRDAGKAADRRGAAQSAAP